MRGKVKRDEARYAANCPTALATERLRTNPSLREARREDGRRR